MPKIDKIKEQIAWLANNYDNTSIDSLKLYMGFTGIVIVSAIIIYVNKIAFKKINSLEEL